MVAACDWVVTSPVAKFTSELGYTAAYPSARAPSVGERSLELCNVRVSSPGTCRTLPAPALPPALLGLLLAWSDALRLPPALRLLLWDQRPAAVHSRENVKISLFSAPPSRSVWPNAGKPWSGTPLAKEKGAPVGTMTLPTAGEADVQSLVAILGRVLLVLAILGTLHWLRPF